MGIITVLVVKIKNWIFKAATSEGESSTSIPGGGLKNPQKDKE